MAHTNDQPGANKNILVNKKGVFSLADALYTGLGRPNARAAAETVG